VDVEPAAAGKKPAGPEKQTILGQHPITPVAAAPRDTIALVQPTHSATVTDDMPLPSVAQTPAAPTTKVEPPSASIASEPVPRVSEPVVSTGGLVFWIGVVAAVGVVVAVVGSLWVKGRGGAGL